MCEKRPIYWENVNRSEFLLLWTSFWILVSKTCYSSIITIEIWWITWTKDIFLTEKKDLLLQYSLSSRDDDSFFEWFFFRFFTRQTKDNFNHEYIDCLLYFRQKKQQWAQIPIKLWKMSTCYQRELFVETIWIFFRHKVYHFLLKNWCLMSGTCYKMVFDFG